jgi:hypothetical protein
VNKCSLVETAFLLLVTVSTVNMLTTVLNDSPVFPEGGEDEPELTAPLLMDSPQCVLFGTFMIWFASITINLGPTFLSGALAANSETGHNAPSCPLVHGPFRHYVLNVLWILINVICVVLTLFHLHKLHRDLTKANVEAVKVAGLVTTLVSVTGSGSLPRVSVRVLPLTGGPPPHPLDGVCSVCSQLQPLEVALRRSTGACATTCVAWNVKVCRGSRCSWSSPRRTCSSGARSSLSLWCITRPLGTNWATRYVTSVHR